MLGRIALLVSMVCASTRGAAAGPRCASEADANAAQNKVQHANEARFTKALASHKLKPIALAQIPLGPSAIYAPVDFRPDQVTSVQRGTATVRAITALEGSCGGSGLEFGQRGKKVFRIERQPRPGKTTRIITCNCLSPHFTCGGARVTVRPVGYVLPAGTAFGGVLRVAYTSDQVDLGPTRPCPPIAPPP